LPSTYTTRNRLTKQATGENTNTWGALLNSGGLDLIDAALDGVTTISAGGATTLSSANGASDQSRTRVLNLTASVAQQLTVPSVEKWYFVRNPASVDKTVGPTGGTQATVRAGEAIPVLTDGANAYRFTLKYVEAPTEDYHPCTKLYADNLAFTANAGILPGQTGSSGKFLTTNGTVASWAAPTVAQISDYASDQATKTAAATSLAIAFASAL
jgi:hypothetical protein